MAEHTLMTPKVTPIKESLKLDMLPDNQFGWASAANILLNPRLGFLINRNSNLIQRAAPRTEPFARYIFPIQRGSDGYLYINMDHVPRALLGEVANSILIYIHHPNSDFHGYYQTNERLNVGFIIQGQPADLAEVELWALVASAAAKAKILNRFGYLLDRIPTSTAYIPTDYFIQVYGQGVYLHQGACAISSTPRDRTNLDWIKVDVTKGRLWGRNISIANLSELGLIPELETPQTGRGRIPAGYVKIPIES